MQQRLKLMDRIWYQQGHPLAYLLSPLSWVYNQWMKLRFYFYQIGLFKKTAINKPIIVVGNITIGGTGKTPLVIALIEWFKAMGWRPGVISRGYAGGSKMWPQTVETNSDAKLIGDEPLLIKQKTGVPIVVGPHRIADIKQLLAENDCDVVISDDGLQHLAMDRDVEIVVIDEERRFGNGMCLPAGPLRESVERLKTVDFVVMNGGKSELGYQMQLKPGEIYQLQNPQNFLNIPALNKNVHAVAGIGNPERFFVTLKTLGLSFEPHIFSDHFLFEKKDFQFGPNALIIMTEKDAVKCAGFADENFWCLPVQAEIDSAFFQALLRRLTFGQSNTQQSRENK